MKGKTEKAHNSELKWLSFIRIDCAKLLTLELVMFRVYFIFFFQLGALMVAV